MVINIFYIIYLLVIAFIALGIGSFASNNESNQNARKNIDWEGDYTGIVMLSGGPVVDARIKLNTDNSFEMDYVYLGKAYSPFNAEGKFRWDNTGNIIMIDINDVPSYYLVTKNMMTLLDHKGSPIDNYVLKKRPQL
jgi:uncharacterized lipoprotein NlpE involved in copper resistance